MILGVPETWEELKAWWSGLAWYWKVLGALVVVVWFVPMLVGLGTDKLLNPQAKVGKRQVEQIEEQIHVELEELDEEEEEIETAIMELTEEKRKVEKEVEDAFEKLDNCDSIECIDDVIAQAKCCGGGPECTCGHCSAGSCICTSGR